MRERKLTNTGLPALEKDDYMWAGRRPQRRRNSVRRSDPRYRHDHYRRTKRDGRTPKDQRPLKMKWEATGEGGIRGVSQQSLCNGDAGAERGFGGAKRSSRAPTKKKPETTNPPRKKTTQPNQKTNTNRTKTPPHPQPTFQLA